MKNSEWRRAVDGSMELCTIIDGHETEVLKVVETNPKVFYLKSEMFGGDLLLDEITEAGAMKESEEYLKEWLINLLHQCVTILENVFPEVTEKAQKKLKEMMKNG